MEDIEGVDLSLLSASPSFSNMAGQAGMADSPLAAGAAPSRFRSREIKRPSNDEGLADTDEFDGDIGQYRLVQQMDGGKQEGKVGRQASIPGSRADTASGKRFVSLKRRKAASPAQPPALIEALTAILSPSTQSLEDRDEPGAGLGIISSASDTAGLGILNFNEVLGNAGLGGHRQMAAEDPSSFPTIASMARGRRALQRRLPGSKSDYKKDSTHHSPSPIGHASPFVSSPLASSWLSTEMSGFDSRTASPVLLALSPSKTADLVDATTSCSPTISVSVSASMTTPDATALYSPSLTATPTLTQSPSFSPSIGFQEDVTADQGTAAAYAGQANYTSSTSHDSGTAGPGSGFYNAVIATTVIGAAMCMGAFGILAWLLLRRRSVYQRPVISQPILKYTSNESLQDKDDPEKSTPIHAASEHYRHSEAPSIPQSVLPARIWRPSLQQSLNSEYSHYLRKSSDSYDRHDLQYEYAARCPEITSAMPGFLSGQSLDQYHSLRQSSRYEPSFASTAGPSRLSQPSQASFPNDIQRFNDTHDRHRQDYRSSDSPSVDTAFEENTADPRHSQDDLSLYYGSYTTPPATMYEETPLTSAKSSTSMKHASRELRKTAIIAAAQGRLPPSQPLLRSTVSAPDKLGSQAPVLSSEITSSTLADLSRSVSVVLLDQELPARASNSHRQRPMSQDGNVIRNKLKKPQSQRMSTKSRPVTIGAAPPSILVTTHSQALVPPVSPKITTKTQPSNRMSLYSLSDTLPYMTTQTIVSPAASPDVEIQSHFVKGDLTSTRKRQSTFVEEVLSNAPIAAAKPIVEGQRSSLAESCQSDTPSDPSLEGERARRSQRRRTLLQSVVKQEEANREDDGKHIPTTSPDKYQTPKKVVSSYVAPKVLPQPDLPITPPYTPTDVTGAHSLVDPIMETPTRRSRSTSAGAPQKSPTLDASLTRFSRMDLASEFAKSKFGAALKGQVRDGGPNEHKSETHAMTGVGVDAKHDLKAAVRPSQAFEGVDMNLPVALPSKPPRRARASTISCDQIRHTAADTMMQASRVQLPAKNKATRVSFAPSVMAPAPTINPTRSIAQDLRASVSFPSTYEHFDSRPTSFRTSLSSFRSSGDYDFGHAPDFDSTNPAPAVPDYMHNMAGIGSAARHTGQSRASNGSLTLPKEDDDDDGSVYSRDSGSHESPWEIAKARVRARASLALPSVIEELA